jgi:2'-5' RNA ligase
MIFAMHRLFVALEIPEIVADALSTMQYGVDGARWRDVDSLHLTLAFIGETDRHGFAAAMDALAAIDAPAFEMRLTGVGVFGDKKPRSLWAGVEENPGLRHLQAKVETALRRAGFSLEKRKFIPHVTLAYLRGVMPETAMTYCAAHGLFSCGPFPVNEFHLYSSRLGNETSVYDIEASYALSPSR